MLTKGAIGNLVNRYRAVLKKCNLINVFGSLAVASMLVLGGAGVAEAVQLGDKATYKAPVSETEFIGNNNTVLTIIGRPDAAGSEPTISTNEADVSIKNINTMIFEAGWGDGEGTQGSNATVATGGKTITLNNIKEIKSNGSIADHNYFFHAFGGNYTFTEIGKINLQSGGIAFMAQPIGANDANINVTADEINIKTGAAAVQSSKFTNTNGTANITLNAKNITLESATDHACVTVYNPAKEGAGSITITATETLSITGSSAVNAQYGNANGTAKVDLSAKNIIIKNNGSSNTKWPYALSARNYGEINVTPTEKANISGDIRSLVNSKVNVSLGKQGSLTGAVETDANSSTILDFGTDSTWNVTGDSTVTELKGSGTIVVDSADTTISAANNGSFTAKGSAKLNDQTGGDLAQVKNAVENLGVDVTGMDEGLISGAVDANGNKQANTVMQDTLEIATSAPLAIGRIVMNDVRKRMGDLRDASGEAGAWMRWDGGKLKGDEGLTNNFNTIQIGADMLTGIKNVRAGVAAAFTHGDLDHRNGNGEMETYSFSAYGTWMADNGMFADVIARVGFTNTELSMKGRTIDLDNEALSLSGEYGWRFDLCQQFYVEPQVELTYTYVTEADSKIDYATYEVDSMDSLLGRAGMAFGWKLPDDRGNIYARASVVHEFLGDAKITGAAFSNTEVHELNGEDTWLEYGIGANVKLTDKTYIWADVERTEGADIEEEWRGTVGIRYSF